MSDWIGLAIIGFVIVCVIFLFSQISKPYNVSTEEFEKRAQEGPGLINAAMVGMQKMLEPGAKKAIEVQEDLRAGHYNKKDQSGDPPEAGEEEEQVKSEK